MQINMRKNLRNPDEMRNVSIETGVIMHAEGSCLVKFGNTHVICTATVEKQVPPFLRNSGQGWVTAEYSMLPRATNSRTQREASKGRLGGRTLEIQRLIGRSLRAVMDLHALGERQIIIDCDVIQADGGTRTASITGAYVAMHIAIAGLLGKRVIHKNPIKTQVAAISCGIVDTIAVLDLDYQEDSNAMVDANFVLSRDGQIIELQSTGEQRPYSKQELDSMFTLATHGIKDLMRIQRDALGLPSEPL
jgi:ribonuclease PH